MSNDERVSKSIIDRRTNEAKRNVQTKQRDEHGYNFCIECGRSDGFLDSAHTVSVDRAQKEGRCELAWDENNIRVLCRECHQKLDGLDLRY